MCFTEGDEGYLAELVVEKGHAPWGVILDQDRIVQRGVKPVRYVHESDVPPADDRWRNVRYNHAGGLDWYWEREWRWRGDEALGLQPFDVLAVVVEDPTWPGPAMVPELQPDGDVLPAPAVPEWINGIERFLWVPERPVLEDRPLRGAPVGAGPRGSRTHDRLGGEEHARLDRGVERGLHR